MKKLLQAFAAMCFTVLFVRAASADLIPFSYSGSGVSVAGTLSGESNGNGSWTITGIDARYNGIPVAGIIPTGVDSHFIYDNLYFSPAKPTYFDNAGLLFRVPGVGEVNLCYVGPDPCGNGGYTSILWDGRGYTFTAVEFARQKAPVISGLQVPEPPTMLLMGGGLIAAAESLRRKLRRRRSVQ